MIGWIVLGLFVLLIAVIAVRTIRFTPKPQPKLSDEEVSFDKEASLSALQQLVRCKTISYNDHSLEDEVEFRKLIDLILTVI